MTMKKPPLPWSSRELECVGRLEFTGPNPIIGFLCGSIPVPTDKTFHETYNSAFIPSRPTVSARRYQLLPMETDLNRPPLVQNVPEKVLPIGAVQSKVNKGENLTQKHSNQSMCGDQSLFSNFAMHSVGNEDYECLPTHHAASERQSNSSVLPRGKKNMENKDHDPVEKALHVDEKTRCSIQESGNHRRVNNDEFSMVLYCQFHNFCMLLASDLLIFSNEKNDTVSLHLCDVTRQVAPLTWLDAWLDNVMASMPELAICYHENGVVKGYKLLKTNDIFLLEGISNDGTPAFCAHVVQQNGLSVLKFLQENCKQDPGVYWLYKNAGEYVIQPFHTSIIPENHSSSACDDSSSSLPLIHRGKSD